LNERPLPPRRGRGPRPFGRQPDQPGEPNPYRDVPDDGPGVELAAATGVPPEGGDSRTDAPPGGSPPEMTPNDMSTTAGSTPASPPDRDSTGAPPEGGYPPRQSNQHRNNNNNHQNGRHQNQGGRQQQSGGRGRRNRGHGPRREHAAAAPQGPPAPITPDGDTAGWFDSGRDGGYIRRPGNSYLPEPGDAFVPPHVIKQYALRRGDAIVATVGRDPRGRVTVVEITQINDGDPALALKRPDFSPLIA